MSKPALRILNFALGALVVVAGILLVVWLRSAGVGSDAKHPPATAPTPATQPAPTASETKPAQPKIPPEVSVALSVERQGPNEVRQAIATPPQEKKSPLVEDKPSPAPPLPSAPQPPAPAPAPGQKAAPVLTPLTVPSKELPAAPLPPPSLGLKPEPEKKSAQVSLASKTAGQTLPKAPAPKDGGRDVPEKAPKTKTTATRQESELRKKNSPKASRAKMASKTELARPVALQQTFVATFVYGRTRLGPKERKRLRAFLKPLRQQIQSVRVDGYTCTLGSEKGNQRVSEQRAASVAQLIERYAHADSKRVEVKGWGENKPLCTESTLACRKQNRRVEVTLALRGVTLFEPGASPSAGPRDVDFTAPNTATHRVAARLAPQEPRRVPLPAMPVAAPWRHATRSRSYVQRGLAPTSSQPGYGHSLLFADFLGSSFVIVDASGYMDFLVPMGWPPFFDEGKHASHLAPLSFRREGSEGGYG